MTYNELRAALKDLRDNKGVQLNTALSGEGVTKDTLQAEYDRLMSVMAPISPQSDVELEHISYREMSDLSELIEVTMSELLTFNSELNAKLNELESEGTEYASLMGVKAPLTNDPAFIEVSKIDNFFSDSNKSFLDLDKVSRYTEAYQNGANFPPIEVVKEDNGRYTCYDGHHRLAACRLLFTERIYAIVD